MLIISPVYAGKARYRPFGAIYFVELRVLVFLVILPYIIPTTVKEDQFGLVSVGMGVVAVSCTFCAWLMLHRHITCAHRVPESSASRNNPAQVTIA